MQLVDALQAQNESRAQHEVFHNLLDRCREPFSVVTEYFGHGMFNKIFIVEETDDIIDYKKVRKPPVTEARVSSTETSNTHIKATPRNPFEEDISIEYDESKNPFAEANSTSLNPFE